MAVASPAEAADLNMCCLKRLLNHHCPLIGPAIRSIRALVLSKKKGGKRKRGLYEWFQAPLDSSLMIVRNKEIHQLAGKNTKRTECSLTVTSYSIYSHMSHLFSWKNNPQWNGHIFLALQGGSTIQKIAFSLIV